jgi:hypothetical protein
LFDDDGETFAYERRDCHQRWLTVATSADGNRVCSVSNLDSDWPSSYGEITWRFIQ